jgi:hypothetical protein
MTANQANQKSTKLIDRIDNAILEFNKKIATKIIHNTNVSKDSLERTLYGTSAVSFGVNMLETREYLLVFPTAVTLIRGLNKSLRPNSADYEYKTFGEGMGEAMKYLNVILYGVGVVNTTAGVGGMIAGAVTSDAELLRNSFKVFTNGLGALSWMSADYISKTEIEPKPKIEPKEPYRGNF